MCQIFLVVKYSQQENEDRSGFRLFVAIYLSGALDSDCLGLIY